MAKKSRQFNNQQQNQPAVESQPAVPETVTEQPVLESVDRVEDVERDEQQDSRELDESNIVVTKTDGALNIELDANDPVPAETIASIKETFDETAKSRDAGVSGNLVHYETLTVAYVVQQLLNAPNYCVEFESGALILFERVFNNAIGQYVIATKVFDGESDPIAADIAKSIRGKVITGQLRG